MARALEHGADPGRLLILKLGSTLPFLKTRRGDFEDWIIDGAGLSRAHVQVIDVPGGARLPDMNGQAGVIVTGSHSMVTDRLPWSEQAAAWLRDAVARGTPVLGICYGHQLLAHAHGGTVGNNPNGSELGTREVAQQGEAGDDLLLGALPRKFAVHESHTQSVLSLPPNAVRLASNEWDACQAFRIGDRAWGVQFHPEFDAEVVRSYIAAERDMLVSEGQDPDALQRTVTDTPLGGRLLRRFAALCRGEG